MKTCDSKASVFHLQCPDTGGVEEAAMVEEVQARPVPQRDICPLSPDQKALLLTTSSKISHSSSRVLSETTLTSQLLSSLTIFSLAELQV